MSTQIEVEYKDKEKAKQKGALWDAELKTWYIPNGKNLIDFSEWIPVNCDVFLKNPLYIAFNTRVCWKCKKETQLIALCSNQFIALVYQNDETGEKEWRNENFFALFSDITYIPKSLIEVIQKQFTFFKLTYSKTLNGKYWANTCTNCNSLQGDWFNHHEPDGAFFPSTPAEASKIVLIKVELKHDTPIAGGYSLGDSNDLIEKYSKRKT